MVLAIHQRTHACHALRLEARDQCLEELRADTMQAQPGFDLDREYPARRRLAEFPSADLARDKAGQRSFVCFSHEEMPVWTQHVLPVLRLVGPRQPAVQSGNRWQIRS